MFQPEKKEADLLQHWHSKYSVSVSHLANLKVDTLSFQFINLQSWVILIRSAYHRHFSGLSGQIRLFFYRLTELNEDYKTVYKRCNRTVSEADVTVNETTVYTLYCGFICKFY